MKAKTLTPVILLLWSLFMMSTISHAGDVKEQMIKRLPVINKLKSKGIIGENKAGLLEYRTGSRPNQDVVQAENADRKKVYAAIAKKQNVPAAKVGARRALQIADKARTGTWLQKPDGSWYQK